MLSRDARTGTQSYKAVVDTVTTHPDALYTVTYDPDGDGPLPPGQLVTTAPHPFFVSDYNEFVPAADLRPGDTLVLADGASVDVVSLAIDLAAVGETFTTYNFEVADFHTYFVGDIGVWVHNSGRGGCEMMFSLFRQIQDTHNLQGDPWEAFLKLLEKTEPNKFKFDAFLRPTTEVVFRDVYAAALNANPRRYDLVPSVSEVAEKLNIGPGQFSRMSKIGYENHHTVPKYVQELLFQLDNVDRDSVPALLLSQADHIGANPGPGRGSFHSILYKYIRKNARRGDYTRQEILDGLRQAYHEFGRPDVWAVAEEWLRVHGVS